jgi:phosphate transport system substrate-binding protein
MRQFKFVSTILRLVALLALLGQTACAARLPATPTTLRVAGSTSMTPALRELAEAYSRQHPNVTVEVRGGDSAIGMEELARGEAALAAVSWRPDSPPPADLHATPVARDALALIVHPYNQTPGLTLLQARALYRGEILDWRTLGGPEGEPVMVSREDGSGTRAAFEAAAMGSDRVTLDSLIMPDSQAVVDYVATHRLAVGYVSMAALDERVRVVPVEDSRPTPAALRSGAYHLVRTLYLVAPAPPSAVAQSFLDFTLSPAGQAIIARHHVALR